MARYLAEQDWDIGMALQASSQVEARGSVLRLYILSVKELETLAR